jgi:predicted small metal-binding protein
VAGEHLGGAGVPVVALAATPAAREDRHSRQPERRSTVKQLQCSDVGFDCEVVIEGETEDEVMQQAAEHARVDHGIEELDAETAQQVRAAIRDA